MQSCRAALPLLAAHGASPPGLGAVCGAADAGVCAARRAEAAEESGHGLRVRGEVMRPRVYPGGDLRLRGVPVEETGGG